MHGALPTQLSTYLYDVSLNYIDVRLYIHLKLNLHSSAVTEANHIDTKVTPVTSTLAPQAYNLRNVL
jgi:hypothetical protein